MNALVAGWTIFFMLLAGEARAGLECPPEKALLKQLEAVASGRRKIEKTRVYCLSFPVINQDVSDWTGPGNGKRLRAARAEKRGDAVATSCGTILAGKDDVAKGFCVHALAAVGRRTVGDLDVLDVVPGILPGGLRPDEMLLLAGKDAGKHLVAQFNAVSGCGWSNDYDVCPAKKTPATRTRWQRRMLEQHRLHTLSALSHTGDLATLPFIEQVAKGNPSRKVRRLAKKVVRRLKASAPQPKNP